MEFIEGLIIGCIFCLLVDGPIIGGLSGREGAIIGCIFLFTGRWAYNLGGL